jgi:hypothetical protein
LRGKDHLVERPSAELKLLTLERSWTDLLVVPRRSQLPLRQRPHPKFKKSAAVTREFVTSKRKIKKPKRRQKLML